MQKKMIKRIKLVITFVIIFGFIWFLVISPMMIFHNNESKLKDAALRYFELYEEELPTKGKVKTLSLNTLYKKSFLKNDFYIPYTKKTCSIEKSWVKVKNEDDNYKYYVYLNCGVLSSSVDSKGPEIKLNGDSEITVNLGDEYKELGVKSVIDNSDGKIDIKDVIIKGDVNTLEVGTYEVSYVAYDSLNNKTEEKRVVNVVQGLANTIKKKLGTVTNFIGDPSDNYLILSNILFRIYGIDENNDVIVVSDNDISNVNYTKLDKWLDYFYSKLNNNSKKMIVPKKYCNMDLSDTTLDTIECSSFTKKKKIYIPSVIEVNRAAGDGNFMKPATISWVSNKKSNKEAYVTRNTFFGDEYDKNFLAYSSTNNYGVRPMFTISGKSLIVNGDGTYFNPYTFGDTKPGKGGSLVNERETGEYISINGDLWRIVSTLSDGTTKVIKNDTVLGNDGEKVVAYYDPMKQPFTYNPKDKSSVAYFINNSVSKYIDTTYFVNHIIKVPIYKNNIVYQEEVDTKEYKAVLSAPDMYEVFSAQVTNMIGHDSYGYWLINTSKENNVAGAITDIGVVFNEKIQPYELLGVRPVAYLKKDTTISSGNGTSLSPYVIK